MLILEDQEPKVSVDNPVSQVSNTIFSLSKPFVPVWLIEIYYH